MATNFKVQAWNGALSYKKFDIIYANSTTFRFHYATQDIPGSNSDPSGVFNFAITSYTREDDATTVYYTKTGNGQPLAIGCILSVTGMVNSTINTTGLVIDAGSGWAKYLNEGWPESSSVSVGAINCTNPAWTSGFMFVPSYSTSIDGEQNVIQAKFGDGYGQRQRAGLNSNTHSFKLAFNDRSDREAKALFNFVEDKGGVDAIKLLVPINRLFNNHTLRFTLTNPQLSTAYYDSNNISVQATQAFDL